MIRSDEDFFGACDRAEPFTQADARHLRAMLSSESFIRAAKEVLLQTDVFKNRMLGFNFGDPKDQAGAARLQGQIAAYPEVFGLLVDLALKDLPLEERQDVQKQDLVASSA
jgi:hypothetical protein